MNRNISKVTILGSGVMGSRIACHFANIGVQVLMLDMKSEGDKPNKIANDALAATLKSNPSPIFKQDFAKHIRTGNFTDNMKEISASDWVMEVVVEDKQLSLAIGKKGQNVRLASKLTGWRIDIKMSTPWAFTHSLLHRPTRQILRPWMPNYSHNKMTRTWLQSAKLDSMGLCQRSTRQRRLPNKPIFMKRNSNLRNDTICP